MRSRLLFAAFLAALLAPAARADDFPLKDGDVWVMAGDSITAQHLHSNYFEAFCFARYPDRTFAFRNSGVGGHTIPSTLARFDYDVAAWKPTVVSVELGMNDQNSTPTDKYVANMGAMVDRIRGVKARPVLFTASPINNGETAAKAAGGNKKLLDYAAALKAFAEKEKVAFADQLTPLLDVWGRNKQGENLANTLPALRTAAASDATVGVQHLRAFLAEHDRATVKPVTMMGDAVHPGAPGQLMMAAALLKALGADPEVSSVVMDATGKVAEAKGCKVEAVTAADGGVAFDRADARLPFPIDIGTRPILAFDPTVFDLSRYMLAVTGLKEGRYAVSVDKVQLGEPLTAAELAKGVNLTSLAYPWRPNNNAFGPKNGDNAISLQGEAILKAVGEKEAVVSRFRTQSAQVHMLSHKPGVEKPKPGEKGPVLANPSPEEELAKSLKLVEAADAKIRAAAKPKTLHFTVLPVK